MRTQAALIGVVKPFDKGRKLVLTVAEKQEIHEYYMSGHNYGDITKKYNIRANTIRNILKEFPDTAPLLARKGTRFSLEKEFNVLFKKYFMGQKQRAIVLSEGISKQGIYRIQGRNKEVIKIFTEARKELAQDIANRSLECKGAILGILADYISEVGKKEKREATTAVQASVVIKNIIDTFGRVDDPTPAEANIEAQEKLCGDIIEAMQEPDWDDSDK